MPAPTSHLTRLTPRQVRRLALARGGLLRVPGSPLPRRAVGRGKRARAAAHEVIRRFGYLQLDSVAVAGARSHTLVLLSRIKGLDADLGEELLAPGEPLFEYWGHEACWLPLELYPTFEFRRRDCALHPWWGDTLGEHPKVAEGLLARLAEEGPLRSLDLDSADDGSSAWRRKIEARVMLTFWSRGDVAIRSRSNFQRTFDLAERVIPDEFRTRSVDRPEALRTLLLRALAGHGWATTGTLAATWRLRNLRREISSALEELCAAGEIAPADLDLPERRVAGWVRTRDLEQLPRLTRLRPRRHRGVLLSPFDPILWDRRRVADLFGFDQVLEIYKPKAQRRYGYYCLPVLAGDRLVARVDLKAHRKQGRIDLLACHYEAGEPSSADRKAVETALARHCDSVRLKLEPK